jgi:hypothetical protein
VDLLAQEESHLRVRHDRAQARLQVAVERFVALDHQAVPTLLAVLTTQGRTMVEKLVPTSPTPGVSASNVEKGTELAQKPESPSAPSQRRSRRHRSPGSQM